MAKDGYNPMRWDCETKGCFNKRKRPKIEVFHGNFPGKINFSDVDGIVEISGNALMLEWKDKNVPIPKGQQIMYERLSEHGPITVMCVAGDAETMEVYQYGIFHKGKFTGWKDADMELIQDKIRKWTHYALDNPKT